jgi:hypothetical protein
LFAPGARTIRMCSLDGRSQKLLTPLLGWVWTRKRVGLARAATLNYEESQRSLIQIFLVGVKSLGNRLGELPKIVQVMATDLKDDVLINCLIAMNGDVSESDRFGHALAERGIDELKALERLEILRHRGGWTRVSLGDQMGGQIDVKLDGTLKIQGDNVL